jgi:DNA-binding response OmpR family regulator
MSQHILVVDDEPQICELLSIYLQKQGYTTSSSGNSKAAMEFLGSQHADLVVLDIGLADDDGLRVLTDIKKQYPAVKVIMLTGMGLVEDLLQEAVQKGADGYVSKDLPLDELLMSIERMFRPDAPALQGAA